MRDDARFKLNQIRTLIQRWEKILIYVDRTDRQLNLKIKIIYRKLFSKRGRRVRRVQNTAYVFWGTMAFESEKTRLFNCFILKFFFTLCKQTF